MFYQSATNLSDDFVEQNRQSIPNLELAVQSYNLPYLFAPPGGRVLIVGAGMGNDVAAALRMGMGSVDAVEIDPAIQKLGVELHPEKPYDDERVHRIVDDARSFFVNTRNKYDVIAFGLLDSHMLLSSLSSVRLDSYVYTLESFTQAREHLAPDGIVAVTFAVTPWIEERLGRMMVQVFGPERVYLSRNSSGSTFVGGQLTGEQLARGGLVRWAPSAEYGGIPLTTDDWPYFYMRSRSIPDAYWQMLLLVGVLAVLLMRRSFPEALHPDWHFWLLGAGFLLIEFTSVTRLALLFGTTWLVNALAISGVLLMILGANLIVLWRQHIPVRLVYGLMFASLILVYFFPLDLLNGLPVLLKALAGLVLLSLPLFFSGMIFSESLRRAGETARPLASNLTGSVAGGVLEYSSIWWGVQSLYVTAAVVYLLALLAYLRKKR